jgi:ABC-type sugar transport system permease subunit
MEKKRFKLTLSARRQLAGVAFTAPFIIGFVLFLLYPLIQSLQFSFSSLTITQTGFNLRFVGLENYHRAFAVDPLFIRQLFSAVSNMFINVTIVIIFGFFLASVLSQKFIGRTLARAVFFLPVIISTSIIQRLDNEDFMGRVITGGSQYQGIQTTGETLSQALINYLIQMNVNQGSITFVVSTVDRIYDITIMSAVPIVIFLAGLQTISPSIFEAAYIEGASGWEVFWKIKFPLVSPLILVCFVYCTVDSFTNMTNPVIARIHGTVFGQFDFGFGLAMAWSYVTVIILFLIMIFWIINRRVVYQ